jgi:glucosamine 6-phosphate synthetase-like amidotransferase/phosphosugar isomerase protein
MCALFGWLDYKGILPCKVLRKLTQALANAAEERGTDASGIAYVRGDHVTIYKRPKPAHKVRFKVPGGAIAVMGHTRLTTQGNEKFNYNNHPFFGHADKDFAFAHNGVLYNDSMLRKSHNLPKTHIETDSYIAVQLIEEQGKLDFDSLKSMAENVQGNFTFTVLDENNKLYFVKGSNPLYLINFKQLGLYVYASTKTIMDNALKKVGMQNLKFEVVPVVEGNILSIDCYGKIERSQFETFEYGFWDGYGYYDDVEDYDPYHEDMLLEVCNCFGVEEENVLLLLDNGYTVDDIEEMLMDTKLLDETVRTLKYKEDEPFRFDLCDICES